MRQVNLIFMALASIAATVSCGGRSELPTVESGVAGLIPWSGEEEELLIKSPLRPLTQVPGLFKRLELEEVALTVYLFYPQEGGDNFYEYFGKLETLNSERTFSLPLQNPVIMLSGAEAYLGQKNNRAVYNILSEQFGEALERVMRIIPLPAKNN